MKPTTIFLELALIHGIVASAAAGVKGLLSLSLFSNSTQCAWKEVAGTQSHVLICNTTYHASGTAANGTFPWASAKDFLNIPSHFVLEAPGNTIEDAEEPDCETELEDDDVDEDEGNSGGIESSEVEEDLEDEEEEVEEEEDEKMEDETESEYEELDDTDEEDNGEFHHTYINGTTSRYNWKISSTNTLPTATYSHITSSPSNHFTLTYDFPSKSSRKSNEFLFEDDGHFRIGFGRTTTGTTLFPRITLVDDGTTSYVIEPPVISTSTSVASDIPKQPITEDNSVTSYMERTSPESTESFITSENSESLFTTFKSPWQYYTTTRNDLLTWPKTTSTPTTIGIIPSSTRTSSNPALLEGSVLTSSKMRTVSISSSQIARPIKAISKHTGHSTITSKRIRDTSTTSSTTSSKPHSIKQTKANKYITSSLPSTLVSANKTALNFTKSFGGVIYNNRTINYFSASRGIEISWMLAPILILFFIMSL
ncbi:hypothetical protein G9P44_002956 [Scheffersomyces stipitis]|nr:hypothetical protein G9P44_002956 [Scheffersomyces stipitis]